MALFDIASQEFDTPVNLFMNVDGIFHSMCVGSGITADEIQINARA
jgi:hypothetical protein